MKTLSFSEDEYRNRLARTQEAMAASQLDVLVCHNLANICYLTGFRTIGSYGYGHYAVIVPASGEPTLFSSDFESHNALLYSWLDDVVIYDVMPDESSGPVEVLANLLHSRGYGKSRIGYEVGHYAMTISEFSRLKNKLPDAAFVDATMLPDSVKLIKSQAEIEVIRRAAALTSDAMASGINAAVEGGCDNDIAAAIYETAIQGGGEYFSLQPIVTSGKRSGVPHSTFHRQPLENGDNVFIEVSASYERYSSPSLRTVVIGEPSAEVKRAFSACAASVECLIEYMKSGASGREVARKAGERLRAIEPNLVWHGYYGYSIGLTFPPMCSDCVGTGYIAEKEDLILQEGMVFHCSTSLRKIGCFGVTAGDTVLVTKDGCEVLTTLPRELVVSHRG